MLWISMARCIQSEAIQRRASARAALQQEWRYQHRQHHGGQHHLHRRTARDAERRRMREEHEAEFAAGGEREARPQRHGGR